ncbi:hypothetical protein LCGC14_0839560 [marine sediment metagenome]|uniref:Holliday junction resolvase RecU n=1 Tax=marine sediment metagenome TaxID=412755 RepID=A0A0F9SKV5_9ZZZZ
MDDIIQAPSALKGKELEKLCMLDAAWQKLRRGYSMGRYGVQVQFRKDPDTGKAEMTPVPSLPDFEGALPPNGRQFITDAKVTSSASFSIHSYFAERQLSHMLDRADYGVICFILIHFNERVLKRSVHAAMTYAFPVYRQHAFWQQHDRGEVKSIDKLDCSEHGAWVKWWLPERCRAARPNLLAAVKALGERRDVIYPNGPLKLDDRRRRARR